MFCLHVNTLGHFRVDEVKPAAGSTAPSKATFKFKQGGCLVSSLYLPSECVCVSVSAWVCVLNGFCFLGSFLCRLFIELLFFSSKETLIHLFTLNAHLSRAIEGQEDIITEFCSVPSLCVSPIIAISLSISPSSSVSPLISFFLPSRSWCEVNQEVGKHTLQSEGLPPTKAQINVRTVQPQSCREPERPPHRLIKCWFTWIQEAPTCRQPCTWKEEASLKSKVL